MTADSTISRELSWLQEELAASGRKRASHSADRAPPNGETATRSTESEDGIEEKQRRGELCKGVKVNKEITGQTETNVSARSTWNVMSAMVVGILVGRMLGRRRGFRHDQ